MGIKSFWLTMVLVVGISTIVVASKGGGEDKEKKGYVLKFNGFEVKKNYVTPFSLMQQGAVYRGIRTPNQSSGQHASNQSVITFQKGNTIYLYPIQPQCFIHKLKVPTPVNR